MRTLNVSFLTGYGLAAFSLGIHLVVLSWLAVDTLDFNAFEVGLLSALGFAPSLILVLVSGVLSDKAHPGKLLGLFQCLLAACYLGIAFLYYQEALTKPLLYGYAFAAGFFNSLSQPLREKLSVLMKGNSIQRNIGWANTVRFSLQCLGIILLTQVAYLGLSAILFTMAFAALISGVSYFQLDNLDLRKNYLSTDQTSSAIQMLQTATKLVLADRRIRSLFLLVASSGFFHLGAYTVVVPVVSESLFNLETATYAVVQLCFYLGLVSTYFHLTQKQHVARPGYSAVFGLLYTALVVFSLSRGPTIYGFYFLIFAWGWVASHTAAHARLVLQSIVPADIVGRVIALYQLILFAAAFAGSLAMGWALDRFETLEVFSYLAVASVVVFFAFYFFSPLFDVTQPAEEGTS